MRRFGWVFSSACVVCFATAVRGADPPRLVVDLEPKPAGSHPQWITEFREKLYFVAQPNERDQELWVSDGTPEGSRPILRLRGALPGGLQGVTAVGDRLFFLGRDLEHGCELWVSDGTEEGTRLVKDAARGPEDCFSCAEAGTLGRIVPAGRNAAVLSRNPRSWSYELWASDGTASGTRLVVRQDVETMLENLAAAGDTVFFPYWTDDGRCELWAYEGVFGEPRRWKEISPGGKPSFSLEWFVAAGDKVFFIAYSVGGTELWVSDGTPDGTEPILSFAPDKGFVDRPFAAGDSAYFLASDSADAFGLWFTDGKDRQRIHLFRDEYDPTGFEFLAEAAGQVFFRYYPTEGSSWKLWVARDYPNSAEFLRDVADFGGSATAGARVLYKAYDSENHRHTLWVTDGTVIGTEPFFTVRPGTSFCASCRDLGGFGTRFFFAFDDEERGVELWTTSGSAETTELFLDARPGSLGSDPVPLGALNGRLLFCRREDGELFSTDGTAEGTKRLGYRLIFRNHEVAIAGGRAFFAGNAEVPRSGLVVTDGTPEGTKPVFRMTGTNARGAPLLLTAFGDRVFFVQQEESSGWELWVSDGTPEGTGLFADIVPGTHGSKPQALAVAGGRLFVVCVPEGGEDRCLWVSDGTPEGTRPIEGVRSFAEGVRVIGHLAPVGATMYFTFDDGRHGLELWLSDGTSEGTRLVEDIYPGRTGAPVGFSDRAVLGSRLVFCAANPETGPEPWVSDGTPEGTRLLRDIWPGPESSFPAEFVALKDRTFFAAEDPERGRELWVTDGTPEGTRLVADILPGPRSSSPASLAAIGDLVYFAASDGERGAELWVSDGAPEGTRLLWEIEPGPRGSEPRRFFKAGAQIFFTAVGAGSDAELWVLPLEGARNFLRGDVDGDGRATISDAVSLLVHLFQSGPEPGCLDAADVDDGGTLNLEDAVFLLLHLFRGGEPPAPPSEACGEDPTEDGLDCAEAPAC
ncbi:MAG: ELWxxDGT repeat protein [Planctomycetota bacterium]